MSTSRKSSPMMLSHCMKSTGSTFSSHKEAKKGWLQQRFYGEPILFTANTRRGLHGPLLYCSKGFHFSFVKNRESFRNEKVSYDMKQSILQTLIKEIISKIRTQDSPGREGSLSPHKGVFNPRHTLLPSMIAFLSGSNSQENTANTVTAGNSLSKRSKENVIIS